MEDKSVQGLNLTYIIGTYPGLTTTFIDREIKVLRKLGVRLQVLSIRRPWTSLSAEQKTLQQGVMYLMPVAWLSFLAGHLYFAAQKPLKYFGVLFYLLSRSHPTLQARMKTFLHFAEGVYAAYRLRSQSCDHLHAHFVDRAATVALVAGRLLGIPYSLTAHASDIYVDPVLLPEKLAGAKFVATCTGYNKDHLSGLGEGLFNHKLSCIYHGLDASQYRRTSYPAEKRPLVIAVGQLKERKGFRYLVEACRILLDRGYDMECRIIGEGPLRVDLEAQIHSLGLDNRVFLDGALPHEEVIEKYAAASLFVLPAILGADGDRDGIPNVILEAMAMELPVVSTHHSGIPEVVEDGVNGLLVSPADAPALASALAGLLDDPECRREMGKRGRKTVVEKFDPEKNIQQLLDEFIA